MKRDGLVTHVLPAPKPWAVAESPRRNLFRIFGAGGQTRTDDLLITNQLLYRLSYAGFGAVLWDRSAAPENFQS